PWDEHVPIQMHAGPDLIDRLDGVEVLIVEADPVSRDVIETAESLRVIGICRGDPVNVDIEAATKAGIPVVRAPGRNADAVVELVDLDDLLERSDVVSIHAAVTPETRGMLGEEQFARMKQGAYFVNSARFGIADEQAVLDALRSGRLAGAAFDHFEGEFLPADHPLLFMTNVVLTP